MERVKWIDMLRGFAIFLMIPINLAGEVLADEYPLILRAACSLAAPIFIMLSGFMASITLDKHHSFKYYILRRGLFILFVGVLVDVIVWQIYPFTTFDVLYLIGISIPIAYLAVGLKSYQRIGAILVIIVLTPILQQAFGYTYYPIELGLNGEITVEVENQTGIANHLFVDGWFPLFPWLALSLIGIELADIFKRKRSDEFGLFLLYMGLPLVILGILTYLFIPSKMLVREGYNELFYPPSIQYLMSFIGASILSFFFFIKIEKTKWSKMFSPLGNMGKAALPIYFVHLFVTSYLIAEISDEMSFGQYAPYGIGLIVSMWVFSVIYLPLKRKLLGRYRNYSL